MTSDGAAPRVLTGASPSSEEMRELLSEEIPALVSFIDSDLRYRYVNRAYEEWFGHPRAHVLGKTMAEVLGEAAVASLRPYIARALAGERVTFEREVPYREGGTRWIDGMYVPRQGPTGIVGFFVLVMDVTERKRAEADVDRIKGESDRLRRLYETALSTTPDFVYVIDLDHRFTYTNPALLTMWGRTWENTIGKRFIELGYEPWHAEMHDREIDQVIATKRPIRGEVPFNGTHGRRIYDYIFVPVIGADGNVEAIAGTTRDVTDRKRNEEETRESERRFRNMADNAPVMIWVTEPNGHCSYLSRSWYEFTGQTPETGLGMGWLNAVHPDDRPLAADAFVAANATKGIFRIEYRLRRHDGEYRWAIDAAAPRIDESGQYLGYIGSVIDITDRKAAEEALKQTAENLERSNRELEQFAYVASHDLQEPLRVVTNYLQLLEQRYGDRIDDTARKYIDHAVGAAFRMKTLIQDLLSYSRASFQRNELSQVDCTLLVEEVMVALHESISASRAEIDYAQLPVVEGDRTLLSQLFQNLLSNAIKYNSRQPKITIRAERTDGSWTFSFADNGIGIESAYFDKVFGMFQRLHSRKEYSGTGIGLSICKKIVEKHGGKIWLESRVGEGSTFYFTLPAAPAERA